MFMNSLKSGGVQGVIWEAISLKRPKDNVGAEVKEGGESVMGREYGFISGKVA